MKLKQQIMLPSTQTALIAVSYRYVLADRSHDYYPFGQYMPGRYATDTASNCITTTLETIVPGYFDYYMSYADMSVLTYSTFGTVTEFDTTPPISVVYGGAGAYLGGSVITVGSTTPPAHAIFLGTSGTGSGVSIPIDAAADHITIDVYSLSMIPSYTGMLYEVLDGTGTMVGNITSAMAGPITIPLTIIPHSTDLQLAIFGEDPSDYVIITGVHIPHDTTTAYNTIATVCNNDFYKYGFNGQMKDNEWAGLGNHVDFGERGLDTRTGRWSTPDKLYKNYPSSSPYGFVDNSPIRHKDQGGEKWVNAYDAVISQYQAKLAQNPNDKQIKKDIAYFTSLQKETNEVIEQIRSNDPPLYNYIDNLTFKTTLNSGETVTKDIEVVVGLDFRSTGDEGQSANTERDPPSSFKVDYNGRKITLPRAVTPSGSRVSGFNVTIYGGHGTSGKDVSLANEAGDVMYYMEYTDAAEKAGSDKGTHDKSYTQRGTPGEYSNRVESTYIDRKRSVQKSPDKKQAANNLSNPYPLPQK